MTIYSVSLRCVSVKSEDGDDAHSALHRGSSAVYARLRRSFRLASIMRIGELGQASSDALGALRLEAQIPIARFTTRFRNALSSSRAVGVSYEFDTLRTM